MFFVELYERTWIVEMYMQKKMLQFFTIINIFSGWRERIYHGAKLNFYYEK
jgi:hypothetical protein